MRRYFTDSDRHGLNAVAVCAVRFGYLATWSITELDRLMDGHPVNLAKLRAEFTLVLRHQLPPHQARRGGGGVAAADGAGVDGVLFVDMPGAALAYGAA